MRRNLKQAYNAELKTNSQYYMDELHRLANTTKFKQHKLQQSPNYISKLTKVNIVEISAMAFYLNLKCKDNELFSITLYKLDREINCH